jgi:hypothetical protein
LVSSAFLPRLRIRVILHNLPMDADTSRMVYSLLKSWRASALSCAALLLLSLLLPATAGAVMPDKEQPYRDALKGENVKIMAFAPGDIPFAAAILDMGTYGEYRVLTKFGKEIRVTAKGTVKLEQMEDSRVYFITGGAHAFVVLREPYKGSSLSTIRIYDPSRETDNLLLEFTDVLGLYFEPASATEMMLWQLDNVFYNSGMSPHKFNYFLLYYDPQTQQYHLDFHVRQIDLPGVEEGVALNNRAVQLYLQGDIRGALAKLDDAAIVGQIHRGRIAQNARFIQQEADMLRNQRGVSSGATRGFDDAKLDYLLGEYDMVIMTLGAGTRRVRQDQMATMGLAYAHKRDYDGLQKASKLLTDADYEYLTGYLEEVARIIFYDRNLSVLQVYLKALEARDPGNPTLAYLKAAVLADAGNPELAARLLDNYLAHANPEEPRLWECREFLYELASLIGDIELGDRMEARLTKDIKYNLTAIARYVNFNTFWRLHTEVIKVPSHFGTRIPVPESFNLQDIGDLDTMPMPGEG